MNTKYLLIAALVLLFISCGQQKKDKNLSEVTPSESAKEAFEFGVWTTANEEKSDEEYLQEFGKYSNAGIDEVLINTGTDPKLLSRLVPLAKEKGLRVHAWIMAMNRPGDTIALKHPEWYQVSKEGKSCFDTRPYVGYYQWLCPTRKESRNHVLGLVEDLAKVEGIESVHLDYIRFPDIFLPIGLLPKYNLVQDEELPEYDFCYCDVCIREFEKIHHKNPLESKNTAIDMEWKNFRLNAIKSVVDDAYKIVHDNNKILTAAVFPYPEMADHMVRQRWDKWDIDEVYPMIYHGFYNEEVDWIGYATKQGVTDTESEGISLNTGIYIPDFKTTEDLKQAIIYAKENGAKGVSFFDGNAISDEFFETIKTTKANL
ncbi:family 10 glycosylhydrolase [Aestuariibaculum suncheonense]|uniref:Family 10 glycosylhydrolase n=1 Tax=Aestuariibaculum suncheonense TaxID=1028745 RepID=A0A8J6QU10_9FLAO|nr:putative glycoside hydrolase [Aestuariibaculum suncheonense]MBD0835569.1 family 10 glycosylhydrolase [Aestuariibaculum suncheonense]